MRSLLCWGAAALLVAATTGCGAHPPGDTAASGATALAGGADVSSVPPINTPVGPVPGPQQLVVRPQDPYKGDLGATGEGRRLFVQMNCSGCHGGRAGGGMGPSLRDVDWLYGASEAQIFSSIAEGRAHGMPAWGTKLTDDQIWKLVSYIKSLRTPDEPDAPR